VSVAGGGGDASVSMEPEGDNGQQLISHHLCGDYQQISVSLV